MLARPGLPVFDYLKPASLAEAAQFLADHPGEARPMMGGTDLFVRMRDGALQPRFVVDVKHLPGMADVTYTEPDGLRAGAAVTLNRLAAHPDVRERYAVLAESAASVASYQVRNRATLGGNLANASPAADTAPALLVLEGELVLAGPAGERRVPAADFFLGPGRTAIAPGELLAAVHFPPPPPGCAGRYLKLGRNRAGDLSIVGAAVLAYPDPAAVSGWRFRIALASVAPTPLRVSAAEELLAAGEPGDETFTRAAEAAMQAASPIDDVRASAAYRRAMVRTLVLRGLRETWDGLCAA